MERIARFFICLCAALMLCACAKTYKDIKVTSFDLVSVNPRGLTKVDALIELGLDNPIVGFEVFDACGVVKLDGEPALTITADQLVVAGRDSRGYRIPLRGELAPGFNPLGLLSLVQEMPCERWCTYLFRSKDLSEWECGRYNPMLMWDDDDRRVSEKAADITPEFAERIRTGFVCNASDVEFCEFGGRTCIDYLVGDQRGFYYMAEAWYDGPLKEYLERQFE